MVRTKIGRIVACAIVFSAGVSTSVWLTNATAAGSPGRDLFEKRCAGCHTLDSTKVGPGLRSVFLRKAGSVPNFPYSDGLKNARFMWDATTLDRWLSDPDAVVPDNDMSARLENSDERAAIIGYLKELSGK